MPRFSIRPSAATLTLVILSGAIGMPTASAAECRSVRGSIEETVLPASECTSPVGLCADEKLSGQLRGDASFIAAKIIPTDDTPATGVVFVTGDITIADAKLGRNQGTLTVKSAASFRTVGDGDLTDTQVITGGTGDFAGATGSLRISGNVVGDTGAASYKGTVCLP